ncbi:pyrroline-5-carboxylate reductase [Emcibacter sp.]|uniref:pyrroline-5-carboxylate reductase n=1 Tax=Emcibacter sp. TaxID=1979954 RepID=UPI003A8E01BA
MMNSSILETDCLSGKRILLIGCGNMGKAILNGWLSSGVDPDSIFIVDPGLGAGLPGTGIPARNVSTDGSGFDPADIVVLAVKPGLIEQLSQWAGALISPVTLLLSVAAGVTVETLKGFFPNTEAVMRVMPNLSASIGQSASTLFASSECRDFQRRQAALLFQAIGRVFWIEKEEQMHAVTALAGSGPAYIFLFIEAVTSAAVAEGLPESLARELAVATVAGAGNMAVETHLPAEQLRRQVSSPKGTTVAGLAPLMEGQGNLYDSLKVAISAAAARSRQLAGE